MDEASNSPKFAPEGVTFLTKKIVICYPRAEGGRALCEKVLLVDGTVSCFWVMFNGDRYRSRFGKGEDMRYCVVFADDPTVVYTYGIKYLRNNMQHDLKKENGVPA